MSSLRSHLQRIGRIGRGSSKRRGSPEYYKRLSALAAEARLRKAEQKRIALPVKS